MRRGFTLLELLVAITIFMVIAGASWALLEAGRRLSSRVAVEAARAQAARAALRAIEGDLRGAFSGTSPFDTGFKGTSGGTEERPLDAVEFVSFAHQPAAGTEARELDLVRVAYSIDGDARTEQSGLVREKKKRIAEVVTVVEPGEGLEEIAREVVGLDLRYFDGSAWQASWDSTVSGAAPTAVEIVIHVSVDERVEKYATRLYLPVAATAPRKQP